MPTKAIYQTFENNPDEAFDYFLAAKLSMTVAELRRRMSTAEWVSWNIYYAREAQHRQMAQLGGG